MPNTYMDAMRLLRGGAFAVECNQALADMIRGVEETGKPGKLTVTLDVKKHGAAVSVLAKVTDKTPEPAVDPELFYATVEGNLSLNNPKQRDLDLQVVEHGAERKVHDIPSRPAAG